MRKIHQYLKKCAGRRFTELILMILFLNLLVFYGFSKFRFGEALLANNGGHTWYLEFSGEINDGLDPGDIIISNPESYPSILKPENIGKQVIFIHRYLGYPVLAIWVLHSEFLYLLELQNDFYLNLYFVRLITSVISSAFVSIIIIFIDLNRKKPHVIYSLIKSEHTWQI